MRRDALSALRYRSPWRATWLHFGFLLLALVGAWLSYSRPFDDRQASGAGGVVVVQAGEGDVERLVYEGAGGTLEIESRRDALGRWFVGREGEGTVFVGGSQVERIWSRLEPLRAVRVLDEVRGQKLEELELIGGGAAGELLSLTVRGRDLRYRLGGTPFGGSDRYAQRVPDATGDGEAPGRVLVLPSEVVADVRGGAELLMERRLLAAARPEVEAMGISRPGVREASLRVVQRTGANPADTYWTLEGSEEANVDLGAWVDKFFRLSAAAYRGDEPAADWRPEATITVESREHGPSKLDIWSAPGAEDAASSRVWFARSPFTRLVVELSASLAEEVCSDLDGLW